PHLAGQPALADSGINQRGFAARIAADDQARVGFVDAGNAAVEDVSGTQRRVDLRAVLAAVAMEGAELRHQVLQGNYALATGEIARDRRNLAALQAAQPLRDGGKGLIPARLPQLAVLPYIGPV